MYKCFDRQKYLRETLKRAKIHAQYTGLCFPGSPCSVLDLGGSFCHFFHFHAVIADLVAMEVPTPPPTNSKWGLAPAVRTTAPNTQVEGQACHHVCRLAWGGGGGALSMALRSDLPQHLPSHVRPHTAGARLKRVKKSMARCLLPTAPPGATPPESLTPSLIVNVVDAGVDRLVCVGRTTQGRYKFAGPVRVYVKLDEYSVFTVLLCMICSDSVLARRKPYRKTTTKRFCGIC
jgi:hypothetical protein